MDQEYDLIFRLDSFDYLDSFDPAELIEIIANVSHISFRSITGDRKNVLKRINPKNIIYASDNCNSFRGKFLTKYFVLFKKLSERVNDVTIYFKKGHPIKITGSPYQGIVETYYAPIHLH